MRARATPNGGSVLKAVINTYALLALMAWAGCAQVEESQSAKLEVAHSALVSDKLAPIFGLPAGTKPVRLVVKFKEGSDIRLRGGRLSAVAASGAGVASDLVAIDRELSARGVALGRLLGQVTDAELSSLKQ